MAGCTCSSSCLRVTWRQSYAVHVNAFTLFSTSLVFKAGNCSITVTEAGVTFTLTTQLICKRRKVNLHSKLTTSGTHYKGVQASIKFFKAS